MWYFSWVLGLGFAVLLAILNAMWGENEAAGPARTLTRDARPASCPRPPRDSSSIFAVRR